MTTETDNETPTEDAAIHEANQEAAKRRRQLREVKAERDHLRDQLTAARRQIIRDHALTLEVAPHTKLTGAAFDDANLEVDTMFSEDGKLSEDALNKSLHELHEAKPYMFEKDLRHGNVAPQEGHTSPAANSYQEWENAFSPDME